MLMFLSDSVRLNKRFINILKHDLSHDQLPRIVNVFLLYREMHQPEDHDEPWPFSVR